MDKQSFFPEFEKSFWKFSRTISYLWKEIYEETFPGSQSHILFLLERNGPQKMSELAKSTHLTPGAVTTASDRLIDQGYIVRNRNEEDRRVIYLDLTEKGRDTLGSLQNKGRRIMEDVFQHVSNEDLKKISEIYTEATINIANLGEDK